MASEHSDDSCESGRESGLASKLDAAGWGLFFMWVGFAWLVELPPGTTLLGIAAITLGEQIVRRTLRLRVEIFWVVVGAAFALAGVWALSGTDRPLFPVLMVLAGAVLLLTLFRRRPPKRDSPHPRDHTTGVDVSEEGGAG